MIPSTTNILFIFLKKKLIRVFLSNFTAKVNQFKKREKINNFLTIIQLQPSHLYSGKVRPNLGEFRKEILKTSSTSKTSDHRGSHVGVFVPLIQRHTEGHTWKASISLGLMWESEEWVFPATQNMGLIFY